MKTCKAASGNEDRTPLVRWAACGFAVVAFGPEHQTQCKLGCDCSDSNNFGFHFAASRELTEGHLATGVTAVVYETLYDRTGRLPLLTPMSEVAGKMSIQEGAKYLERPMMGRGILLGGVTGVEPANVLILGDGVVGANAARVAAGMGANVTIMDINLDRLRYLDEIMPANVTPLYCDPHGIERCAAAADLIIGAVLIPGKRAPALITRKIEKCCQS